MNKFLIIEDNDDDYSVLANFLKTEYPKDQVYPSNSTEHDAVRKNFRKLFSADINVREEGEKYFKHIDINSFNGVLLDYELDEDCRGSNGIQLYKDLKIKIPALILTKYTGIQYVNIEHEIEQEKLSSVIKPIQKGSIMQLSEAQKKYYKQNIDEHLLKIKMSQTNEPLKKILIVTTTKIETTEFHARMVADGLTRKVITHGALTYWHYGTYEANDITMIKLTEMGSAKSGGSTLSITEAIDHLDPDYIIMIGIAFGLKHDKQKIGDILVSRELQDYDSQKKNEDITLPRGHKIPAGNTLLNRFDNSSLTYENVDVELGLIISGGTLSNSKEFVAQLRNDYPEAIGGEMEGVGLQASCVRKNKEWILIKGICDWGQDKNVPTKDEDQKLAIANVCDYLLHTLSTLPF